MKNKNIFHFSLALRHIIISMLFSIFLFAGTSYAAINSGYTEFYVPGSEDQMWDIFWALDGDIGLPRYIDSDDSMHAIISVTATGDSTTVYYDHWEDGYDFDPADPDATADEVNVLDSGGVWELESSSIPVNPRDPAEIFYDGRDRLYVAGAAVTVSRSSWIEEVGTSLAISWELYPVKPFLTDYTIPVGEDLATGSTSYTDFERVYVLVLSTEDGNSVQIDNPTTPNVDLTASLDKGEVTQLYNVNAGTHISSTKPVQVQFIVGSVSRVRYEARGYNSVPDSLWDTEYYSPVDGSASENTDLYIYNPNNALMLVDYEDKTDSGTFAIPSNSTISYEDATGHYVPNGSGVYLSSDDVFWGIGSVDSESISKDWGFTLVPENFLTDEYFLSWAPGSSDASPTVNGSPAFVSPVQDDTVVKVDYSPIDGIWDVTYTLNRLDSQTIFDPDNDNTGMHIWASGPISVVWGQDPDVSDAYAPYLDLGSSNLPMPADWIDLILGIEASSDPSVLAPAAGEITTITLAISSYDYLVSGISVEDILPSGFSYVDGTTEISLYDSGDNLVPGSVITGSSANPNISGQTLQWDNTKLDNLDMGADEVLYIAFDVVTDATVSHGTYTNYAQASGIRMDGAQVFSPFDSSLINVTAVTVDKDTSTPEVEAGGTASYSIRIENISSSDTENVVITDVLPTGFSFDSGSGVTIIANSASRTSTTDPGDGDTSLQWDTWTISPDGSVVIEFNVDVDGGIAPITYDNTASVSFDYESVSYSIDDKGSVSQDLGTPSGEDDEDDEDVSVASLTIDKDTTTSTVNAGGTGQYTIILHNSGSTQIDNVIVYDNLPEDFTFNSVSYNYTGGASFSGDIEPSGGSDLEWDDFDIPSGATVEITFDVDIAGSALPGTYDNTAYAYSAQIGYIDDAGNVAQDRHTPDGEDPEDDEDITVQSAVLTIDKDTSTPYAVRGSTDGTYTITVENTGTSDATNVVITDTLPAGFSFDSNVLITETNATRTSTNNPGGGDPSLQWDTWTISPNGSVVIEFNADIAAGTATGTKDNTAEADYDQNPSAGPIDDDGTTAQDTDTPSFADPEDDEDITVYNEDTADLSIDISHSGDFTVGQTDSYSIVVTNNGPSDETNTIIVQDTLPAGLTYDSFSGTGWSLVSQSGQVLTFEYTGTLNPGDSTPALTLNVATGPVAYPEVTNSVSVSSSTFDPDSSNDSDDDETVIKQSDLSTSTKSVSDLNGGNAEVGDTLRYTITLIESGGEDAVSVSVTDDIDSGVTNFTLVSFPSGATESSDPTGGTNSTGYIDISNITVSANTSETIIYEVTIDSGTPIDTEIDNTAVINNPDGLDTNPAAPTVTVAEAGPSSGTKPLYFYTDSGRELSRVIPSAAQADEEIAESGETWTLTPATSGDLAIHGGDDDVIEVVLWLTADESGRTWDEITVELGTPADPDFIGSVTEYSTTGLGTTTPIEVIFQIPRSTTVNLPAGSEITVTISHDEGGTRELFLHPIVSGEYSRAELDTDTVVNVESVDFYDGSYPGGTLIDPAIESAGNTVYARATVTDPFGSFDITGASIDIIDSDGTTVVNGSFMSEVFAASSGVTKIYEYEYDIPVGGPDGSWTFSATAEEGAEGDITHTAAGELDVLLLSGADVSVTKSHDGNFSIKQNNEYTLNVSNLGPEEEPAAITVTDILPAGLTYVSSSGTGWVVNTSGDPTIAWTYTPSTPIQPGEHLPPITLTVYVENTAPSEVENSVTLSGQSDDNFAGNDSSTDTASVVSMGIVKDSNLDEQGTAYWPDDSEITSGVTYTVTVTNNGSGIASDIEVSDALADGVTIQTGTTPQVTVPSKPIRVTEYFLADGDFSGTSYDLSLDYDLENYYFVIIQGSDGTGGTSDNRGPDENYARLTADPYGTGDLTASSGSDVITLERGNAEDSWVGVVTVVESLSDHTGSGFVLRDVDVVTHSGTGTSGSVTSGSGWSDIDQVMLMGGYNGAGSSTSEADETNSKNCHVRIWPSGTATINWTRDNGGGATLSTATSTVMAVQWGTDWTVQRVNVTGNNGGDGANATGEYDTISLGSSVARANTWVWGTGYTVDNGIGDAAEGVLITLGDGVNQNATENQVAIGSEYTDSKDFEVYALTHPDLAVDYLFKADGDSNELTVDVTVDSASSNSMALVSNGCNGTGLAYPRPMFSARYSASDTIRLERRRAGQAFPAWIQGIDFAGFTDSANPVTYDGHQPPDIVTASDGYILSPGESMVITYLTDVDPYSPGFIENSVSVLSSGDSTPATASCEFELRSYGDPQFVDSEGSQVTGSITYSGDSEEDNAIFLKVVDKDQNSDPNTIETVTVTVTNPDTSDSIIITLYETGVDTGVFANDSNGDPYELPLSESATDPDTLYVVAGATSELQIDYEDVDYSAKDDQSSNVYLVTRAVVSVFKAYADSGNTVIHWETSSEISTLGFYLLRLDDSTGEYEQVNDSLLPGLLHSPGGGVYRFVDSSAVSGGTYSYKLLEVETRGKRNTYGPFTVTVESSSDESLPEMTSSYSRTAHEEPVAIQPMAFSMASFSMMSFSSSSSSTSGDKIRIAVSEPDLYYISASEIATHLGLTSDEASSLISDAGLSLTNQGDSVAYFQDGTSGIYFYGEAIDSIYTAENIYWLSQGTGLVMSAAIPELGDVNGQDDTDLADAILGLQVLSGAASADLRSDYISSGADVNGNDRVDMAEIIFVLQKEAGLRNPESDGPAASSEDLYYLYSASTEYEYESGIDSFDDPLGDFWFWDYLYPSETYSPNPDILPFSLDIGSPVDFSSGVTIVAHLFGGTSTDHRVSISINGTSIGGGSWSGNTAHDLTLSFDSNLLIDGINTVAVAAYDDSGDGESLVYVDSFTMNYQRFYQAESNMLLVQGDENDVITVKDFTDSDIKVFDLSSSKTPALFSATTIEETAGDYSVSFRPDRSDMDYFAVVPDISTGPDSADAWTSVDLHEARSIDYLMIAPEDLVEKAQVLADYRVTKGLTSLVVTLEDVMAEFNNGISDPQAVKDFLTYAYTSWTKAPDYVVLVGKGTYDYKDVYGNSNNLFPPMLINTPDGIFASDNSFADITGDDRVPEMAIGRLPVTSSTELQTVITKIINYESNDDTDWIDDVLMVADNQDDGGDFGGASDSVAGIISAEYTVTKMYIDDSSASTVRTNLLAGINSGAFILNYLGHGGYENLADEEILKATDISGLTNGSELPVFTALTCIAGNYYHPDLDSLGELMLLDSGGGAIASWSPTGLSINDKAFILDEEFFEAIFNDGERILGDAVVTALERYRDRTSDGLMTGIYNLLGDPALQLKEVQVAPAAF